MGKRSTEFTITKKQWMKTIEEWLARYHDYAPLTWDEVIAREGGMGSGFFDSVVEAKATMRSTYPGMWFDSEQTDFSLYMNPLYVYSLLFGMMVVSSPVMSTIGKLETGNSIVDVGGSIFTAYRLLQRGVRQVDITNIDGPQNDFSMFAIEKFGWSDKVFVHGSDWEIPEGRILVCSEYLEHFKNVDEELARLVSFKPLKIYESSSFCMPAYGHFIPITVGGKEHTSSLPARRAMYKVMLACGYEKQKVVCFNRHFLVFNKIR